MIENPLTIIFDEPVNIKQGLSGANSELVGHFQTLHEENKQILKDILTKDVCQIIDLK